MAARGANGCPPRADVHRMVATAQMTWAILWQEPRIFDPKLLFSESVCLAFPHCDNHPGLCRSTVILLCRGPQGFPRRRAARAAAYVPGISDPVWGAEL